MPERPTANGLSDLPARIGAVVVSYFSDTLVLNLLSRLPDGMPVVVIDNSTTSRLATDLPISRPDCIYRHFPENLGFGGAVNFGASLLSTEFILIVNPDSYLDADLLVQGLAEMDSDARIGAMGEPRVFRVNRLRLGQYLTGAHLLVRRAAFEAVRGFDEDFFLFFEDTDLSVRLVKAGYKLERLQGLPRHQDGHSVEGEHDSLDERLWLMGASARLFQEKHAFSRAGIWVRWYIMKQAMSAKRVASAKLFIKGYREARGQLPRCLRDNFFTTGVRRA